MNVKQEIHRLKRGIEVHCITPSRNPDYIPSILAACEAEGIKVTTSTHEPVEYFDGSVSATRRWLHITPAKH